ncbi:extracellular solute-binding protein [Candidatus Parcubacteria bacterium]|nr:MAG: extracellular solute-binding protein [Candidatus Parcubacteria bacterium]
MKSSPFQIILLVGFGVVAVLAMLIFGGVLPGYKNKGGKSKNAVQLNFWGTLPAGGMNKTVSEFNKENNREIRLTYSEKSPASYLSDVTEALASGSGPDFWILSQDIVLKSRNKVHPISFENYPERTFLDNFADISELLIDEKNRAVSGIPFLIDPIVLFWNKDMFSSAGLSQPPEDWEEFAEVAETLTEKNDIGNIVQSGSALGEFNNIPDAKEILSMLLLQAGNKVIKEDARGNLKVVLAEEGSSGSKPAIDSFKFYGDFSNPNKTVYSWNKALMKADSMFAKGTLAMYLGYASEFPAIRAKNPHLNFDIAESPQIKGAKTKSVFGKLYFLALMRNSGETAKINSFGAMARMTSRVYSKKFSEATGLASPRRDLLAEEAESAYFGTVNKSAIMAKSWLEPEPEETRKIFKEAVEGITSGSLSVSGAVALAKRKLDQSLSKVLANN